MKDLMVDIETMGIDPNAAIIQIGACYFDRLQGLDEDRDTLLINVNLGNAIRNGFEVTGKTIEWWISQIRNGNPATWSSSNSVTIYRAMRRFLDYAKDADAIWSHSTFDFVILQNAARKLGFPPMSYRMARDIRTLVDLSGLKPDTKNKPHDALEDALYQVGYCVECFKQLKGAAV